MKKFKSFVKENTLLGLGVGTGQTTPDNPDVMAYLNANLDSSDTQNDQLKKVINDFHDKFHGKT